MRAVVLYEYGDINKLQIESDQQEPPFGPKEVRVRVRATSIERAVKVQRNQTLLVTGAAGGVGRTAVHLALKHGAYVIAGVRSSQREEAQKLGAARVVALDDEKEVASLRDLDAIADTVAGDTIGRLLGALKPGGVLGSVLGAPEAAQGKNIRVQAMMAQPDASRLYELADEVARGGFSIPIACTFSLEDARKAQDLAEHHHPGGKVLLVA